MTSKRAREVLGVTAMTLHNYVKSGKIKIRSRISERIIDYDDDSVFKLAGTRDESDRTSVTIRRNGKSYSFDVPNNDFLPILDTIRTFVVEKMS